MLMLCRQHNGAATRAYIGWQRNEGNNTKQFTSGMLIAQSNFAALHTQQTDWLPAAMESYEFPVEYLPYIYDRPSIIHFKDMLDVMARIEEGFAKPSLCLFRLFSIIS